MYYVLVIAMDELSRLIFVSLYSELPNLQFICEKYIGDFENKSFLDTMFYVYISCATPRIVFCIRRVIR